MTCHPKGLPKACGLLWCHLCCWLLQVVPTVYTTRSNRTISTNQYSVTEHFKPSNVAAGHNLPGVFFFYDLSPIKVGPAAPQAVLADSSCICRASDHLQVSCYAVENLKKITRSMHAVLSLYIWWTPLALQMPGLTMACQSSKQAHVVPGIMGQLVMAAGRFTLFARTRTSLLAA